MERTHDSVFVKGQRVIVWSRAGVETVATVLYPYGVSIGVRYPDGTTHWHYPCTISARPAA
ncbi:hypothetical protein ACIRVF_07965 [Kitasatospora sp. NPDC101157]|uniref:hypothetical protein n=1 Tax=Kitasatospora sp. NPDC101157 TaxID=3364098 RepID=UPI003819B5A1